MKTSGCQALRTIEPSAWMLLSRCIGRFTVRKLLTMRGTLGRCQHVRAGPLFKELFDGDVLFGECGDTQRFHRQLIKEVMTSDPISCSTNDSVHEAMDKMSRHRIGQLPVVHDGELVGLVSIGDLIKALYSQTEAENQHLMSYLYGPS